MEYEGLLNICYFCNRVGHNFFCPKWHENNRGEVPEETMVETEQGHEQINKLTDGEFGSRLHTPRRGRRVNQRKWQCILNKLPMSA